MTNFVLCIHVQIRFASTEKNYSHRLACILFRIGVLVFPKKVSSRESLNISELFRFKDQKNRVFQHIHSNQILIILTLFDNIK